MSAAIELDLMLWNTNNQFGASQLWTRVQRCGYISGNAASGLAGCFP